MELPIAKSGGKNLKNTLMVTFYVEKDYEKSESAGAVGTFQLTTLRLLVGDAVTDVTKRINVGKHFSDEDDYRELKNYLSEVFEFDVDDISITEG